MLLGVIRLIVTARIWSDFSFSLSIHSVSTCCDSDGSSSDDGWVSSSADIEVEYRSSCNVASVGPPKIEPDTGETNGLSKFLMNDMPISMYWPKQRRRGNLSCFVLIKHGVNRSITDLSTALHQRYSTNSSRKQLIRQ